MTQSYTQEKLEEMVVGKQPNPNAVFFEHATLNVQRSNAANRRLYDKKVYIKLSQAGVADSISYEAQQADIDAYPEEYQYFLQNRQGAREVGIEIIPNLDIAHLQELRDYGILTVTKLAQMEQVPHHLEYAHRAAKIFSKALQETRNGSIEEDNLEENAREEIPSKTIQNNGGSEEAIFMPTADRQQHSDDVGRPEVPASPRVRPEGGDTRGNEADRQPQRNNPIDNWSASFILTR
jgi:hypothetical protein